MINYSSYISTANKTNKKNSNFLIQLIFVFGFFLLLFFGFLYFSNASSRPPSNSNFSVSYNELVSRNWLSDNTNSSRGKEYAFYTLSNRLSPDNGGDWDIVIGIPANNKQQGDSSITHLEICYFGGVCSANEAWTHSVSSNISVWEFRYSILNRVVQIQDDHNGLQNSQVNLPYVYYLHLLDEWNNSPDYANKRVAMNTYVNNYENWEFSYSFPAGLAIEFFNNLGQLQNPSDTNQWNSWSSNVNLNDAKAFREWGRNFNTDQLTINMNISISIRLWNSNLQGQNWWLTYINIFRLPDVPDFFVFLDNSLSYSYFLARPDGTLSYDQDLNSVLNTVAKTQTFSTKLSALIGNIFYPNPKIERLKELKTWLHTYWNERPESETESRHIYPLVVQKAKSLDWPSSSSDVSLDFPHIRRTEPAPVPITWTDFDENGELDINQWLSHESSLEFNLRAFIRWMLNLQLYPTANDESDKIILWKKYRDAIKHEWNTSPNYATQRSSLAFPTYASGNRPTLLPVIDSDRRITMEWFGVSSQPEHGAIMNVTGERNFNYFATGDHWQTFEQLHSFLEWANNFSIEQIVKDYAALIWNSWNSANNSEKISLMRDYLELKIELSDYPSRLGLPIGISTFEEIDSAFRSNGQLFTYALNSPEFDTISELASFQSWAEKLNSSVHRNSWILSYKNYLFALWNGDSAAYISKRLAMKTYLANPNDHTAYPAAFFFPSTLSMTDFNSEGDLKIIAESLNDATTLLALQLVEGWMQRDAPENLLSDTSAIISGKLEQMQTEWNSLDFLLSPKQIIANYKLLTTKPDRYPDAFDFPGRLVLDSFANDGSLSSLSLDLLTSTTPADDFASQIGYLNNFLIWMRQFPRIYHDTVITEKHRLNTTETWNTSPRYESVREAIRNKKQNKRNIAFVLPNEFTLNNFNENGDLISDSLVDLPFASFLTFLNFSFFDIPLSRLIVPIAAGVGGGILGLLIIGGGLYFWIKRKKTN